MKNIVALLFMFASATLGVSVPSCIQMKSDSIFAVQTDSKQATYIDVFKNGKQTFYFAASFKNLPFCIDSVARVVQDLANYTKISASVKRSEQISSTATLLEMKTSIVKLWVVVHYEAAFNPDSTIIVRVTKIDDTVLNNRTRKHETGFFMIEANEFQSEIKLQKIDSTTTRIGYVSVVAPNVWIPPWLYTWASRDFVPGMVIDIEKYVGKMKKE